jgi:glutamyl-tRNA synthetase
VNFLALQGHPPIIEEDGSERETFTFEEFSKNFDWHKINPAGAVFNLDKLLWLNGHYVRELTEEDLAQRLLPFLQDDGALPRAASLPELGRLNEIVPLIQTRINLLTEATPLVAPFYVADDQLEIAEDARKQLKESAPQVLDAAIAALEPISGAVGDPDGSGHEWTATRLEEALRTAIVEGLGIKPRLAFGPIRTAVSGQRISPPLFESMEILGKASTINRLKSLRATL